MPLATPTRPMPQPEQLREFLSDLLGQAVTVERLTDELDVTDPEASLVTSVFLDDHAAIAGACIAELPFAAAAGAALAMIPKPVADAAIAERALRDNLRDNFYEVANIATSLLNGPSVAHLQISELVDGVPDPVRDLVVRAAGRRTFVVNLGDYGSGRLALYAA